MSAREYPRLGRWTPPKRASGRKCAVCGASPAGYTDVQLSYFRGDDARIATCRAHKSEPAALDAWGRAQQAVQS